MPHTGHQYPLLLLRILEQVASLPVPLSLYSSRCGTKSFSTSINYYIMYIVNAPKEVRYGTLCNEYQCFVLREGTLGFVTMIELPKAATLPDRLLKIPNLRNKFIGGWARAYM